MVASFFHENSISLILENKQIFKGKGFGAKGITVGELVFNTSMTGYQEILTDPSYGGQIIVFTFPHIGNVGVNCKDQEASLIHAKGIIARSFTSFYNNWRAEESLEAYLLINNIIGITGIDTRALTNLIRNHGSLWGCISTQNIQINEALSQIAYGKKGMTDVCHKISTSQRLRSKISSQGHNVVLYDFGVKKSIIEHLERLGCDLTIVPSDTSAETVLNYNPIGIVLSNGPGNPNDYTAAIKATHKLLQMDIPILGICLGHQILALACKAKTYKMKYGHHGTNHPILDIKTNKVLITTQNHNFAVDESSLPEDLLVTHYSLFDGSVQGIRKRSKVVIGFQGHPEASPGPHDLSPVLQDFIKIIKKNKID